MRSLSGEIEHKYIQDNVLLQFVPQHTKTVASRRGAVLILALELHDHPHLHKFRAGNRKGGQVTVPSRTLPEEQPEHLTNSSQSE